MLRVPLTIFALLHKILNCYISVESVTDHTVPYVVYTWVRPYIKSHYNLIRGVCVIDLTSLYREYVDKFKLSELEGTKALLESVIFTAKCLFAEKCTCNGMSALLRFKH